MRYFCKGILQNTAGVFYVSCIYSFYLDVSAETGLLFPRDCEFGQHFFSFHGVV